MIRVQITSARMAAGTAALAVALVTAPADAQAAGAPVTAPGQTQAQAGVEATPHADQTADIVVTAQFRGQRLQDTPLAITAVNASTLEARSQTSVVDLGGYSPNVNLTPASSISGNALVAFIRGIGQTSSNFAYEPGVGMYIDDVYYGTTFGAMFDLTDLDRVEVLRGPQGTLAGKNSLGGAIKLFTKKPDGQGGGFVEATYGRFNRLDVRASADFKIGDGLYARISGVSKHDGAYFTDLDYGCVNPGKGIAASPNSSHSCKIGSEGGTDVKAGRLALRYAPDGSKLEINLAGDVSIDNSDAVATKLIYANNPNVRSYDASNIQGGIPFDSRFLTAPHSYTSYATFSAGGNYTTSFGIPNQVLPGTFSVAPDSTARGYGVSGTIDYALTDDVKLKSITAYRRVTGHYGLDPDGSPLDILTEYFFLKHSQFTQELRLTGRMGSLIDYTVGGFYYKANDRIQNRIFIPTVLFDFLSNDPVSNRSISGFAHAEVHLSDSLNLIGGIRYTHDKKVYTFSRRNADGSPISGALFTTNFAAFGLDGLTGTYDKGHLDYRIGLNYRWSPELMTYAQVSTGYKGGGVNPTPYVKDQVIPFGPEKLTTWEAGFKSDLFDRVLRLNGAVFYNVYRDIQLTLYTCAFSATPNPCGAPANAGDAHVKGAEFEGSLHPVQGLTIDGSVGYLDFKYTRVEAATGVALGMVAPFNNKWQASAGIEYAADFASGKLTPRLDWTYQSSFYYNAVNGPLNRIDGRSLLNARLTYETANHDWSISAAVTNLTNKFYYLAKNDNAGNFGVDTGVVARPREWAVTVKRRF
ncbi:TonB-dependent receptor [Sphingomonas sp. MMS24-J13]|uniref:TonB-dependent receptor n=1 Tax=Sphingomonas sp. MMS24-J13 TaxID=3238686 RepID=UPI003850F9E5